VTVLPEPISDGPSGCFLALGIGFLTVVGINGAFSLLTGADLNLSEEWGVFLFQVLLVAGPFALLAVTGVRGWLPWGVALAFTALFWGIYLTEGLTSRGDGTGADIGLGLLMLVSPAIVAAAGVLTAKMTKEL
jgi:hypothetical protein